MRWFYGFLGLTTLLAGIVVGRKIADPRAAQELAARAWQREDVEACFETLEQLAQSDPKRAFDFLLSLQGDETRRHQLLERLLTRRPESGPALLEAFLQHPEHHRSFGMGRVVFRACAQVDAERAWQSLMARPGPFVPAFLPAFAEGFAKKNPQAALLYAEKIRGPVFRERFVSDVIQQWSDVDGQGLLAWLRAQPDRAPLAKYVSWDRLTIANAAALQDIAALRPKHLPTSSNMLGLPLSSEKADVWMQHTDWLLALPAGETRTRLCTAAAPGLADLDPEAALKLLPDIQDAQVRSKVTRTVSAFRAAASPQEGLAFANALTDERERAQARHAVFVTWAENDPASAARHAQESGDPDAKIMLSQAGYHMAMTDPEQACRFALENEKPGDAQAGEGHELLKSAVSLWAGREPVAAGRWVKALSEGALRDAAQAGVATALAHRMPEEAVAWAQAIKDAEVRRRTLQTCLTSWAFKDSEKPVKWLEQSGLDEETRKALATSLRSYSKARQSGQSRGPATYLTDGIVIF